MYQLGPMHGESFKTDPKHLGFVSSRYKFVAKQMYGCRRVLEVGCGEGFGAQVVKQFVSEVHGIDSNVKILRSGWGWFYHDIVNDGPFWYNLDVGKLWDGVYCLDVLEHVRPCDQHKFFTNILAAMDPWAQLIVGSPSLESQRYASAESKKFHVNCRTEASLRGLLLEYFHKVNMFGMNDEVVHTGWGPMCHYRLAICTGKKTIE